jgi:hypothetical protein
MRDGVTTVLSEGYREQMRVSRLSTYDDRASLAASLDPTHPYGPTFQDLKPYQYANHPQHCYGPGKSLAGKGWMYDDPRRSVKPRGRAVRKTDWGTRNDAPVMSNIDLQGGRDNPGEPGYERGKVQVGPSTARLPPSLSSLKPYNYGGQLRDFRGYPGFTTKAAIAAARPAMRGKAVRRTDWGTRQGGPVLSDIDLAGGRAGAGVARGKVQQGPLTARTPPSLADLKPYNYGAPPRPAVRV